MYYKQKQLMQEFVEKAIKKCGKGGIQIEILVYECLKSYEIGKKTVLDWIKLLEKVDKIDNLDGHLVWKK
jgi:hypothetical protein|tara:strand:+ start:8866 stop:9075 length:210 start_codon:yes stop_codon:yes gene_type:complete